MSIKPKYQDLTDNLQHRWWQESLAILEKNHDVLRPAESRFVSEMAEGYGLFGRDFKPTTRQFNWLRQLASEVQDR